MNKLKKKRFINISVLNKMEIANRPAVKKSEAEIKKEQDKIAK